MAAMQFCGVSEQYGDGSAVYKLPTNRPTWFLRDDLPGMGRGDVKLAIDEAFGRWSAVADLVAKEASSPNVATLLITVADLGGQSGVLADQQLPFPGMRQLVMRIDENERWVLDDGQNPKGIDLVRVLCHELGHFLGVTHLPASPPADLMEPTYSRTVIRPQAAESKLVAGWYGLPKQPAPKPDDGEEKSLVIKFRGDFRIEGYRAIPLQ